VKTDFDYEESIWGKGTASLKWSDPASFRLRQALNAIKNLKAGDKVLEVGCGAGQFIRAVKQLRSELDCYGCDISESALQQAKNAGDGVNYVLNASQSLPFADGEFGAVLIFDVLEHVDNPEKIVSEVKRILKNETGIFYCFVPCEGDGLSMWNGLRKIGAGADLTKKYAGHINYFSRASLNKLLADAGFENVYTRFSEHFFGQLLGITAFSLMDRTAKKKGLTQINNEAYFEKANKVKGMGIVRKAVNGLVNFESWFWQFVPSPNVHLTARKK
jgi:ubiquinone/menaquinone biosynthesis C-methylase UbiE